MNSMILCLHVAATCCLTLGALRLGKEFMSAWLSFLAIVMNLFVLKQINLFGLSVTTSDALAVGYLLGLNLTQEFFGRKQAQKSSWIALFISCSFVILSQIHLLYIPNQFDVAHQHFVALLKPAFRIIFASLFTFFVVQFADLAFFSYLRNKTHGKYLTLRIISALILSQALDTVLFSFLGLYGLVASTAQVICLSLLVKGLVIAVSTPFVSLSKKVLHRVSV